MRIPVLLTLPHQEPLRESALAFQERRASTIPLNAAAIPKSIDIDLEFAAVPVGSGARNESIAAFDPKVSSNFAVRGYLDVESPQNIPAEADGRQIFADPQIRAFQTPPTCGGTPPVGNVASVRTKLNVAALTQKNLDGAGIALAIMDTGINLAHVQKMLGTIVLLDAANSWAPASLTNPPGQNPVDHGSMCAFDALAIAPKATLLDFPILTSNVPGGSTIGGTLSSALLAYAQLIASWAVAFAAGGAGNRYKALVVNNSWGIYHPSWDFPVGHPGRYCDNPRHPFNQIVATLASANADIVFAAGNCGAQCADGRCQGRTTGTIMGSSAHQDVLTLAGCDTNDARVGYSSQGPSIAGMFQQKPDLTAYTHFLGSEAFGAGSADTGTSAACPVAAGCVAALRSKLAPATMPSANLFTQFRSTARQVGAPPGWNGDTGFGIIDPFATAQSLGL